MRLISATIQGYRSFGRAAEVSFCPRMTGIVGPSGCGKTALLEAIFWVLGGSGDVEAELELLFRGIETQPAAETISVELILAETIWQGMMITVSRSFSRTTLDSEFRINGVSCGNELPEKYAEIRKGIHWIETSAALEKMAEARPRGQILLCDEVDCDLSEAEFYRHHEAIRFLLETNQVILVTQRKGIMELADHMLGVTMEEYGLSEIILFRLAG